MNVRIIERAKREALKSKTTYQVGAVIHRGRKIIAVGYNIADKTHPDAEMLGHNIGHHAEFSALQKIKHGDLKNLEMTIVRIAREDGSFRMTRPCNNCMKIILKSQKITKIHWSNEWGNFTTERVNKIEPGYIK